MKNYYRIAITALLLSNLTGCMSGWEKSSNYVDRTIGCLFDSELHDSSEPDTAAMKEMEQIMTDAHDQFAAQVTTVWGYAEMQMPSRKQWVQYDNHMMTRTIMDFEHGELRIEHLMEPDESEHHAHQMLDEAAHQAMHETVADLDEHDGEMHIARQLAEAHGMQMIELEKPKGAETKPILNELVDDRSLESLDESGMRLTPVAGNDGVERSKLSVRIPFKPGFINKLARRYQASVTKYARDYAVPPSLILAIIKTESAFNPRAVSPIPAYGLMQLVPRSGALDAYLFVYGEKRVLGPDYLFEPGNNIQLGVAYLNLLNSRYLRSIEDPLSRLYCAIAAYNTGAGNVARAFIGTTNISKAASIINALTPEQVFEHLKTRLPYEETQRYIVKVTEARDRFSDWDA